MNIKNISGIFISISLLLGSVGPVWSAEYGRNWLEVRVVDKQSGRPVGDAAVCLGTRARGDQFGALRTAADGVARFAEPPASRMLLTASQGGYQSKQQSVGPLSGNRVIVLNLAPGGGGPACEATEGQDEPEVAGELEITSVRATADTASSPGDQALVSVRVSGHANQIRIAESADFAGAAWQELKPENSYTVSQGGGLKRLYVQVRRQVGAKDASIEVVSPVRVVSYRRN